MPVDEKELNQDVNTSEQAPETSHEPDKFTKEEVDKITAKIRSDTESALGRIRKETSEAIRKATETTAARYQEIIKQREDEELLAAKDEPDRQAAIRERQQRRQAESKIAEKDTELNETKARLQEYVTKTSEITRDQTAQEVAKRLKVDPVKLAKLVKFTDGSATAIEEIASEMPKLNTPTSRNNFQPDSNETAGGTPKSVTQIQEDFIKHRITNVQYSEKMKALGRTP